jgi:Trypsin-like peptidase domain
VQSRPESSGSGFFITEDGYLITNEHVAGNEAQVRLVTSAGLISAKVIKVDAANDLALLKAEGKFAALPVATSRAMKLGGTVAKSPMHCRLVRSGTLRWMTLSNTRSFTVCSHHPVIRVYDAAGNVIETHEHAGDFRE